MQPDTGQEVMVFSVRAVAGPVCEGMGVETEVVVEKTGILSGVELYGSVNLSGLN